MRLYDASKREVGRLYDVSKGISGMMIINVSIFQYHFLHQSNSLLATRTRSLISSVIYVYIHPEQDDVNIVQKLGMGHNSGKMTMAMCECIIIKSVTRVISL